MSIWIVIGTLAAIVVATPVAAIILVSFASLSEESAHTLGGQAPGVPERAARRLLGYHADQAGEVRFAHARRTVPDPGKHAAGRQPQPSAVRTDQRQGAGV